MKAVIDTPCELIFCLYIFSLTNHDVKLSADVNLNKQYKASSTSKDLCTVSLKKKCYQVTEVDDYYIVTTLGPQCLCMYYLHKLEKCLQFYLRLV